MKIRPFAKDDLEALHAISLATGHLGRDASHLYADPRMMGNIYAAPYALLAPDFAPVVDDQNEVGGFAVGIADTVAWETMLERDWWPRLRRQYADPSDISPALWTPDQRRAYMIHYPALTPASVTAKYPAHLHLNLLPRLQNRGVGSSLFRAWCDLARGRGGAAMHVAVNRANSGAVRFWGKQDFEALSFSDLPEGRTLWMGHG